MTEQGIGDCLGGGSDIDRNCGVILNQACSSLANGLLCLHRQLASGIIFDVCHRYRTARAAMSAHRHAKIAERSKVAPDLLRRDAKAGRQRINAHFTRGMNLHQNVLLAPVQFRHDVASKVYLFGFLAGFMFI